VTPILQGIVSGVVFGGIAVASMVPMKFPDKRAALSAAFLNRFAIGLLIPVVKVALPGSPGWLVGLCVGLLLSLPDAIITKAYVPIIVVGLVGGTLIGVVVR
jgi:hypothetical protein